MKNKYRHLEQLLFSAVKDMKSSEVSEATVEKAVIMALETMKKYRNPT